MSRAISILYKKNQKVAILVFFATSSHTKGETIYKSVLPRIWTTEKLDHFYIITCRGG